MVVTHESAPPKTKAKGPGGSSNVPGKEKRLRSKEGCLTCRIRGKKCDQGKNLEDDAQHPGCAACRRLRIECLGYARNRPEWLKGPQVDEFKRTIKMFLAENSPRVQRTPRTSDSGSLPFLTFDNLRNGAATSFVPVGSSSASAGPVDASSPAQVPEGQDASRGDFNPPPVPPTYAHPQYQVPIGFGPPPQHQQLPGHPIQPHQLPHQLPPLAHPHDPNQLPPPAGIPLDPALVIDPALEDANMQTLAPVLAQLGVIGRLRPAAPEQQDHTHVVGYTVSHDRGTPPTAPAPVPPTGENALHNIGVRILEVLIAGGKPVDSGAVRAWAGVVGASPPWGEVVVEIVGATRAEPGTVHTYAGPAPANLDQLGADALRACALMCLGIPGAEEVLAKRLEERRWGEDIAEAGVAENWQRAGEVFVNLAASGIAGAAEAATKLEVRQPKGADPQGAPPSIKPEEGGMELDPAMDVDHKSATVPGTLGVASTQAEPAPVPPTA